MQVALTGTAGLGNRGSRSVGGVTVNMTPLYAS